MSTDIERIKELTALLNKASRAYYMEDTELMSNLEYDALYDELAALEKKTGIVLNGSPTVSVGYEVVSELPKETHEYPMLSLDKTKSPDALADWMEGHEAVLSWKMDGLTIVLTYEGGQLQNAVTRGNGYVGEVVTPNARVFKNVPNRIAFTGRLVLRGEAVIRYSDFERINAAIPEGEMKYKNPRNLCSGSVRQLNSEVTAARNVYLYAFALVFAEGVDFGNSRMRQFEWLTGQGFDVVEHYLVRPEDIRDKVQEFSEKIGANDFPSDGLVLLLEDIAYGESLGQTAKFPRNAIAFKWADETRETKLIRVEWSPSRTGLINPVAVFEPVELEGTTVTRASLHNVSILKGFQLGEGDEITVYKANMIIPQVAENLTRSGTLKIPDVCPVCGGRAQVRETDGVASLYCLNPDCQAKHIKRFGLFVSRDALNIEGMSESTLEKLIQKGFVKEYTDLFHLDRYKDEIVEMEGFGARSYEKMIQAAEKSRHVTLPKLLYSLGIPGVGLSTAKLICSLISKDPMEAAKLNAASLQEINGIGSVIAEAFEAYFKDEEHLRLYSELLKELDVEIPSAADEKSGLSGKTFVITGSVHRFANRNELKDKIISLGGKAAGSVSSKTDYLINNDVNSSSTKNKKARELGIPILSEEDFLAMIGEE